VQAKVEPAMLDENVNVALEDFTMPLSDPLSVVCGGVNSPHGPGVGPSSRHSPPLITFIA
jgi:hypothetical protein